MSKNKNFVIIYPPANLTPYIESRILPLGGLYLANALIKNGYSVAIIDDGIEEIKRQLFFLVDSRTVALGISALSGAQLRHALTIAKFIREQFPTIPIIWGGAHASSIPQQTLQSDLVDYIVWGEGENSLPELLDCIYNKTSFKHIKGIGYKNAGNSVLTTISPYTCLDGIFELPYHLLKMDNYARKMNIGINRCYTVFTSRGCPFRCKFCSSSSRIWPNTKMRYHSIEHILNDVSILVNNYKADGITFADENFFVEEQRLISICEALVASNFRVKYRASVRVDLLSRLKPSTWELLNKTGFVGISMGIESGSQRMLDFMGKGITLEQIKKVDSLLTEHKIYKKFNFMTCLPTETISDLKLTLKLIMRLAESSRYCPLPFGRLFTYVPLPGTELYDISIQHGFLPPQSIEGWTQFDNEKARETHRTVRPWLSAEMINFVFMANKLIEELNLLFSGSGANQSAISQKIKEIHAFIGCN